MSETPPNHVPERAYTDEEWQQRLAAAVAETLRKRAIRAAERREFQARRDAGLVQRYAAKTSRTRQEHAMPDQLPPCCQDLDDPPCPQHRSVEPKRRQTPAYMRPHPDLLKKIQDAPKEQP